MTDKEVQQFVILDGNKTSRELEVEIAEETRKLGPVVGGPPHLAAILVGEVIASRT